MNWLRKALKTATIEIHDRAVGRHGVYAAQENIDSAFSIQKALRVLKRLPVVVNGIPPPPQSRDHLQILPKAYRSSDPHGLFRFDPGQNELLGSLRRLKKAASYFLFFKASIKGPILFRM